MRLFEFAQDLDEIIMMPDMKHRMDIEGIYQDTLHAIKQGKAQQIKSLNLDIENVVIEHVFGYRIFLLKNSKPIFYIGITKFHDGYKTGSVHASDQARGQGFGVGVYLALSSYLGAPLYSDSTQTDSSRLGIWKKLIQQTDRVVGYDQVMKKDIDTLDVYQQRNPDEDDDVESVSRMTTPLLKLLPP
jgi:hypothetical protein